MPAASTDRTARTSGTAAPDAAATARTRAAGLTLALADLAAILVFAVMGRASHGLALDLGGLLQTAWPFAAAAALAWAGLLLAGRDPSRLWPGGAIVWLVAVAGGLALRVASGETAAVAFIIVATIALGVLLLGIRAVAALARRRRAAAGRR